MNDCCSFGIKATGFAILGSDVEIELEADYSEKFLAAEEQEALESLFDK